MRIDRVRVQIPETRSARLPLILLLACAAGPWLWDEAAAGGDAAHECQRAALRRRVLIAGGRLDGRDLSQRRERNTGLEAGGRSGRDPQASEVASQNEDPATHDVRNAGHFGAGELAHTMTRTGRCWRGPRDEAISAGNPVPPRDTNLSRKIEWI